MPTRLGGRTGERELLDIQNRVVACRACPRLVSWCRKSALDPPRRFLGQMYWAKPIPAFGDPRARLLIVGLAPAAHGGNRTGRMFTGDSSGDFLFRALHRARFANQPLSASREDGLELTDVFISAAVRCAPPGNRPTPAEFERCRPFLQAEIGALSRLTVVLTLGALAWTSCLRALEGRGISLPRPRPRFGHGRRVWIEEAGCWLVGSYHVSRQNTNTGRLTDAMFGRILSDIRELLSGP